MASREKLIGDLARVATLVDGPPTANEYRKHGTHSVTAIYNEFDSWSAAREAAGVDGEIEHPRKVAREELLADIQRVADNVDGIPVKGDYKTHGEYSISTVYREFEGWPAARAAAGIEGSPDPQNKLSDDELISELTRLKEELEKVPTRAEMNEQGRYAASAYRRAFESWNNAIRRAGLDPNKIHNKSRESYQCGWCETTIRKLPSTVEDQKYIFCSRECKWEFQSENVSGENHHQYDRVMIACANCGSERPVKPSIAESRDKVFCDADCMGQFRQGEDNPNWRGGIAEQYGPNWPEQRKKALEKYEYGCQVCGMSNEESVERHGVGLSVDHLIPRREFMDDGKLDWEEANQLHNLAPFCPKHHREWEGIPLVPELID